MNLDKRRRSYVTSAVSLLVAVLVLQLWRDNSQTPPDPSLLSIVETKEWRESAAPIRGAPLNWADSEHGKAVVKKSVAPGPANDASDARLEQQAKEAFQPVLERFREMERSNVRTLYDRVVDGRQLFVMAVYEPNKDQMRSLRAELDEYINAARNEERSHREAIAARALSEFVTFPKPVKAISVNVGWDEGTGWLTEGYFPTEHAAIPDEKGRQTYPPDSEHRQSPNDWREVNNWAKERYSYLFDAVEAQGEGTR